MSVARWIIPAYAGSTTSPAQRLRAETNHPRIRGEHEDIDERYLEMTGSSPHTRGAPPNRRRHPRSLAIIPAYAGSTREAAGTGTARWDHPRIRGEHAERHDPKGNFTGSSPHTRGALLSLFFPLTPTRIIPAYAGSTNTLRAIWEKSGDHPRIRGEHNQPDPFGHWTEGSSPHTRGARSARASGWGSVADHPRIRGEHHRLGCAGDFGRGSSPHTRGAR